jgi:2,3-bisphosphoglycerate-dependent phosphoglycerate mutase
VEDYLSDVPKLEEAVLAVAGPVLGDEVAFSNSAWRFSIDDVRQGLGLHKLVVINDLVAHALSFSALPPDEITSKDLALNERDYGDLSGLNKDDARKRWGEDQVRIWRRSYDVPPPGGESLKDTLARALPYYVQEILPSVLRDQRTLVAAHGNSLRALVMVLEQLSPEDILKRELATGMPIIYRLNSDSTVASKFDLAT